MQNTNRYKNSFEDKGKQVFRIIEHNNMSKLPVKLPLYDHPEGKKSKTRATSVC